MFRVVLLVTIALFFLRVIYGWISGLISASEYLDFLFTFEAREL